MCFYRTICIIKAALLLSFGCRSKPRGRVWLNAPKSLCIFKIRLKIQRRASENSRVLMLRLEAHKSEPNTLNTSRGETIIKKESQIAINLSWRGSEKLHKKSMWCIFKYIFILHQLLFPHLARCFGFLYFFFIFCTLSLARWLAPTHGVCKRTK